MKFNINEWVQKQAMLNEVRGPIKKVETRIKKGSKFHCLEKKENCTITGFQPYDYDNNEELDVIVQYDSGEKGISYIDSLRSI